MKPKKVRSYIVSMAMGLFALAASAAYAASGSDADKQACFKLHAKLMAKPALMNLDDCWRAHSYLMNR